MMHSGMSCLKPKLRVTLALLAFALSPSTMALSCSDEEMEAINGLQQRALAAGMSLDMERIARVTSESYALMERLSPACRREVEATSGAGSAARYATPQREPSVYYDRGSDTYYAPDAGLACGPRGCMTY
jgi:hypothetical protein